MTDEVTHHDLGYDLTEPCGECPFRKRSPLHKGILKKMSEYFYGIERGEFIHTCHETDDRADFDGGAKLYKGKRQHCIGAILMCEKSDKSQLPYTYAEIKGEFKFENLKEQGDVFTVNEMLKVYVEWAKELLPKFKRPQAHSLSEEHSTDS